MDEDMLEQQRANLRHLEAIQIEIEFLTKNGHHIWTTNAHL